MSPDLPTTAVEKEFNEVLPVRINDWLLETVLRENATKKDEINNVCMYILYLVINLLLNLLS